jgi:6-methylsalicylate decarboxylase
VNRFSIITDVIDIHQHVYPDAFVAALRARTRPPRIVGDELVLFGGDRWTVDPAMRCPEDRVAGHSLIAISPSAALGIDRLPAQDAAELAEAWLEGALELGGPFAVWATAGIEDPDPDALTAALHRGAIGLEIAADVLAAPDGLDRLEPLLDALGDRPVLVHPGPTAGQEAVRPCWWTPTVSYVSDLHAAWWAWADGGRARFPELPICFAALAGLGPLHGERQRARGGSAGTVDPLTFVETSSYGAQGVDAVMRVLGIDVICHGTDAPYATAADLRLDPAALRALRQSNPARLLARSTQEVLA